MRDSIDLDAIKADIKSEEAFQKRFRYVMYAVGGLIGLVLLNIFFEPERISSQFITRGTQATVALLQGLLVELLIFTLAAALSLGAVYYWGQAHLVARINHYSPPYVARITPLNILGSLWPFGVFIGVFALIGITSGLFQALLVSVAFYGFLISVFLPTLIRYFYQRSIKTAYQSGLTKVEEAMRQRPNNLDLMIMKAVLLMEQEQLDEAVRIFKQLLEYQAHWVIPNVPLLLNNVAICLMLQGRYDEACELLENAIRINPLFGHAYDGLASCYIEQNVYPKLALELTTLALTHTNAKLVDSRTIQQATTARAYALLGDAPAAEQMLNNVQQALEKIPIRAAQATEINRQMAYTYLTLGNIDAARSHFRRAIELDPNGLYGKLAKQGLESIPT